MAEAWEKKEAPVKPDHLPDGFWIIKTFTGNYRVDWSIADFVTQAVAKTVGKAEMHNTPINFRDITGGEVRTWVGAVQDIIESTAKIRQFDNEQTEYLNAMVRHNRLLDHD